MIKIIVNRAWVLSLSVMIAFSVFSILGAAGRAYALGNQTIAALTNNERTVRGLAVLDWNTALANSAELKAQDMCAKGYWAHTAPDGATGWTFMSQTGYNYIAAGENLAKDFSSDESVIAGWMASPGHQANILNTAYQDIGVGEAACEFQGSKTTIVVAHYGATSFQRPISKAPDVTTPAQTLPAQTPTSPSTSVLSQSAIAPQAPIPSSSQPTKPAITSIPNQDFVLRLWGMLISKYQPLFAFTKQVLKVKINL